MAETPSTMIPLGTRAPDFHLLDTRTEKYISLGEVASDTATVVMFLCNHCPYVKHIQIKLLDVIKNYQTKGINFIAISANDVETYPEDGPDKMRAEAAKYHYSFPYLYDETQAIAKAYRAACTPDFFVFDKNLSCVYRGRFDDSTPGNRKPATGIELSTALDNIIAGKPINKDQKPSVGCNIKWKKSH